MTKMVPIYGGAFALVDDEDFPVISAKAWHMSGGYAHHTAPRSSGNRNVFMHRLIAQPLSEQEVDHINGDKLDNRKANLRVCNHHNNNRNVGKRLNTSSQYKGVHLSKDRKHKPWRAYIGVNRKTIHLGRYPTEHEAALAYDRAARKYHGEFARLNFPEEV